MYPKLRSSVSGLERHIKSCLERVTEKENKNKLITWMDGLYFTNCNSIQSNLLNTLFSYHSATHISGSKKHIIPSIPIVISTRNSSSNKYIDDFHKSRKFLIFITLIVNTELND